MCSSPRTANNNSCYVAAFPGQPEWTAARKGSLIISGFFVVRFVAGTLPLSPLTVWPLAGHTDESKRTQHRTPSFYARCLPATTLPVYLGLGPAGLHTPGLDFLEQGIHDIKKRLIQCNIHLLQFVVLSGWLIGRWSLSVLHVHSLLMNEHCLHQPLLL